VGVVAVVDGGVEVELGVVVEVGTREGGGGT
jgi:hypothetical protein